MNEEQQMSSKENGRKSTTMSNVVVGIDLGTTNSGVALYIDGRLKVLENKEGGRITPSVVYYTEQRGVVVGEYAKKMAIAKPEYAVYEIKRLIGRKTDDPYVQNNLNYFPFRLEGSNDPVIRIDHPNGTVRKTPEDIASAILKKIKHDVETKLGYGVDKAVITVPAYFNVNQREATLEAARLAGFTVLKLLNEPTAAAIIYYFEKECNSQSYSLVYDLGGGTFDVAILNRHSKNIDIVAVDGDSHLGGHDFDNLIIDYVCRELVQRYNYDPRNDRRQMRRLQKECEDAKKLLSFYEDSVVNLDGFVRNRGTIEIILTRSYFEEMANDLFQRTITIVDNCLNSSGISKSSIKEVILSGGSTRIPKIQEMLSKFFNGKVLNKFVNPDECVAEGAALQGAMLSSDPQQSINCLQITDVIPLSLGLPNMVDLMSFIIKRNTKIPVEGTSTRITVYDQQRSMSFRIFEGERLEANKNHFLGKLTIEDITPAPPGQCEVLLTMKVDANGILTVSAEEKYKNNVKDLKITYARGHRSDKEVKNAVKDARDNEAADRKFEKFSEKKEYLLTYCIRAIYNFEHKGLTNSYKDAYEMCKRVDQEAADFNVDNEGKVKKLTDDVVKKCAQIVRKHNFELMPIKNF